MLVSEIPLRVRTMWKMFWRQCAWARCWVASLSDPHAVRNFKAVEHRLEYVATIRGVEYYNDSKATNVDATIKALESFPANIHLILGGKDKGSDYTVLTICCSERVKRVYTIGAAAAKIESQIKGAAEIVHAETLETRSSTRPKLPCRGYCFACARLRQLRPIPELRTSRKGVQRIGAWTQRVLTGSGEPSRINYPPPQIHAPKNSAVPLCSPW